MTIVLVTTAVESVADKEATEADDTEQQLISRMQRTICYDDGWTWDCQLVAKSLVLVAVVVGGCYSQSGLETTRQ